MNSTPTTSAQPTSAYGGQLSSPVRGLNSQEVDDLLNGRGAGYALMAELNRYPSPRHTLDLKQQLQLTDAQEAQIAKYDELRGCAASAKPVDHTQHMLQP